MTTPTETSVDSLRAQFSTLRARHDAACDAASAAKTHRSKLAGLSILGEANSDEVDLADEAAGKAEQEANALAAALAEVEARLSATESEEQTRRLARIAAESSKAADVRARDREALTKALDAARRALARWDDANVTIASNRAALADPQQARLDDIDSEHVEALADAERRYAEALKDSRFAGAHEDKDRYPARHGSSTLVLNPELQLEARTHARQEYESELAELNDRRAAAFAELGLRVQVESDDELRRAIAEYEELVLRLIPQSLLDGLQLASEFTAMPSAKSSLRHLYDETEIGPATERWTRLQAAFGRLGLSLAR